MKMIDKKAYKSWTISDELWEKAKPLIFPFILR